MNRLSLRLAATVLVSSLLVSVASHPLEPTRTTEGQGLNTRKEHAAAVGSPPNCFPAVGFTMPSTVPSSTTNWWCNYDTEYAFMGFSYEVTPCKPTIFQEKTQTHPNFSHKVKASLN